MWTLIVTNDERAKLWDAKIFVAQSCSNFMFKFFGLKLMVPKILAHKFHRPKEWRRLCEYINIRYTRIYSQNSIYRAFRSPEVK